jgi:putative transposase
MPRTPRKKAESGIYHIMVRGTNKQVIFHDDEDRIQFLRTLKKYKNESGFQVLGWCLMNNHAHILLKEGKDSISNAMKRIGISYVWYYNMKYKTIGHLFQDRYKSEIVNSESYLLTVIRYIHQNPLKAGMVKRCSEWKWSSCSGYYGSRIYPASLLDSDLILSLFSDDRTESIARFRNFNEALNEDHCLEDVHKKRLTDEEAKQEIGKLKINIAEIKVLSKEKRNEILARIKGIEGLTQRQAARILGISLSQISRV